MIDWIQQRKKFAGTFTIAKHRKSNQCPKRSMRVLSAVLAYARHVTFDVTGIEFAFVEGWRKENDKPVAAPDQILFNGCHGAHCAITFRAAGNNRPRLHNRIDAAFIVLRRAPRCAVIEEGAAIPVAVPTAFGQCLLEAFEMFAVLTAARALVARVAIRCKSSQRRVEKPSDPNTFALAQVAYPIHAVVPIARTHQRQAMLAYSQTAIECARTVFKHRCRFGR